MAAPGLHSLIATDECIGGPTSGSAGKGLAAIVDRESALALN
jgi:hypothetical protein